MTNCLYWAVANLPVVCLYKPDSYIIIAEGYKYEKDYKVKCLIHAAINLSTPYFNNYYIDSEGMYETSCIDTWINDWINERNRSQQLRNWDCSTYVYLLKDIKTKKFWKRMKSLGSPYDKNILEEEGLKIFNMCYE